MFLIDLAPLRIYDNPQQVKHIALFIGLLNKSLICIY
jgi:hypothetical protein